MQTICNMCGKTFDIWDRQEDFGFSYHVGYGSKHDGEYIEVHFCCECFDQLYDQIKAQCKVPPVERDYD